jgi:hypothetical protein
MASISWKSGVSGDWADADDWNGGVVPGADDHVTIAGSGDYAVTIDGAEAADSLWLNDTGATIVDTGTLTMGGTLRLTKGVFQLDAGGEVVGGSILDRGGAIQWTGGTLSNVYLAGSLDMSGANAQLHIDGALKLGEYADIYLTGAGATLYDSGGTIGGYYFHIGSSTTDTLEIYDPSGVGATLTVDSALYAAGPDVLITDSGGGDDTFVSDRGIYAGFNNGTFTIKTTKFIDRAFCDVVSTFVIDSISFTEDDNLDVFGGIANLQNTNFTNIQGNQLVGGYFVIGGGILELPENSTINNIEASVTYNGNQGVIESLNTNTGIEVSLESTLTDVLETGSLNLEDGANWTSTSDFFNSGGLALGGGKFVSPRLRNVGTVSGAGVVWGSIINDGTIMASTIYPDGPNAGLLVLAGAMVGTGLLEIDYGATLRLTGSVASRINVLFIPRGTEVLALRDLSQFAATINGFGLSDGDDTIHLLDVRATSAKIAAGDKLVVTNGATVVASLQMAGDYVGYAFGVASDGGTGSYITISSQPSNAPPSPHRFLAAMAGIGAAAATSALMSTGHDAGVRAPPLSPPGPGHASIV